MFGAYCVHTDSFLPSLPFSPIYPLFYSFFFSPAKASLLSQCLVGLWLQTVIALIPSIKQQGLTWPFRFRSKISNLIDFSWYLVRYYSWGDLNKILINERRSHLICLFSNGRSIQCIIGYRDAADSVTWWMAIVDYWGVVSDQFLKKIPVLVANDSWWCCHNGYKLKNRGWG